MMLQVTLAPPPDLVVVSVTTEDSFVTGDVLSVVYNISNAGAGETVERFWRDRVVSNHNISSHYFSNFCTQYTALWSSL